MIQAIAPVLTPQQISSALEHLPGWQYVAGAIEKNLPLTTFQKPLDL